MSSLQDYAALCNRMEKCLFSPFICIYGANIAMTTLSDLTARELEILQLVLAGYTNKAIAAEVFISEKTVEFHLDNIYTKTGARTRLLAALWALQHGIFAEPREIPS
jgi:DNA-binding NarL/FixJ family response regulator